MAFSPSTTDTIDTVVWLLSLVLTAVGIGFWQHSAGLGVAVFFGTLVYLIHRAR